MKRAAIRMIALAFLLVLSGNAGAYGAGWPFWDRYKAHFLSTDGRIVDWSAEECTTSEGEAYALFFSLVANDRASFDLILKWTTENLAHGSLQKNLPSWIWKRSPSGTWGVADVNSASDADLWIAYTLIQAGRIWHSPPYTTLGRSLADQISREEVASFQGNHFALLPGRQGFRSGEQSFYTNPSYAPVQVLTALAIEFPDGPWRSIANGVLDQIDQSVGHGFALDWVQYRSESGFSPWAGPNSSTSCCSVAAQPSGGYDAIRVYLWAGMLDRQAPQRAAILNALSGMRSYIVAHGAPPERVTPDGTAIGAAAPVGFSAAVIPFLMATGEADATKAQMVRLDHERISATGLYGWGQRYYDQNLVLFSKGYTDGVFRFNESGQLQLM
jgi:endo-1,4-beta-D-glucanase Y